MQINMHRHDQSKKDNILFINIKTYRGITAFSRFSIEFQLRSESKRRLLDCKPSTSLIDILRIMSEYRIRRLPVIDVRGYRICFYA